MEKYSVIYADPPWTYHAWSDKGNGRSAENHYPTMSIEDIRALPVAELAAKDCALFMWVTFPTLREAMTVLDAWGFTYKTVAFVWIKENRQTPSLFWGLGYWTRSNAEICVLATKGSPKRLSASVHQVILSRIEQHSKKPDETRDRIVQLMGDVTRVELFARQAAPGWDVWGNEITCTPTLTTWQPCNPRREG
jgi:N6-adenosine-specific RNA methylase IME4